MSLLDKETEIIEPRPAGVLEAADFEDVLVRTATEDDRDSHFLRQYTVGVKQWVQGVVNIKGKPIRLIKSTPMRAFADYLCLLKEEDNPIASQLEDADSLARFPMPIVIMGRPSWEWRSDYGNSKSTVRRIGLSDDNLKTGWSHAPRPLDITFTLDFYAKTELQMGWIVTQIEKQFYPLAYAKIPSAYRDVQDDPAYNRWMPIKHGGFQDNSELEPDTAGDRLLRQTLTITVEGYLFYDIKEAPMAHRWNLEVDIDSGDEVETNELDVNDSAPTLTSSDVDELPTQPLEPSTDGVVV